MYKSNLNLALADLPKNSGTSSVVFSGLDRFFLDFFFFASWLVLFLLVPRRKEKTPWKKINIINIVLKNKINCKKKCKEKTKTFDVNWIIKPGTYENLITEKFKVNIDQIKYNFLEIKYVDESDISYLLTERVERSHLKKENFFKPTKIKFNKNIIKKNNNYIFKHGTHIIDDPIIIPDGFNLIIEGDTILKMSKNSYIMLENGSVKFKGTIDKPIKIIPLENEQKWNGIYVNSSSISNNTSILKHVKISGISYFDNGKIQLTGGLNFINSDVDISNSLIEKSFSEINRRPDTLIMK